MEIEETWPQTPPWLVDAARIYQRAFGSRRLLQVCIRDPDSNHSVTFMVHGDTWPAHDTDGATTIDTSPPWASLTQLGTEFAIIKLADGEARQ